ncbi:hypothetical protein ABT300_31030 [Streptomyces sp. NPDC001027]|uniref:hypothetical protein n=1 Tax=Streptomyces sp. NPDC001027 TaxID=3154771 RepID=UPI0033181BA9
MTSFHTATVVQTYAAARRELLTAMLADRRNGVSANDIVRMAESAWSRPITLDYLNCWELSEDARRALESAGLAAWTDVRTIGDLTGARRVMLSLARDPAEAEPQQWRSLPARIAAALVQAEIAWSFPDVDENQPLDALLDDYEEIQLHRA